MAKPKANGVPIPAVINPPNDICVSFNIPNHEDYRRAVYGAISELTTWKAWRKDGGTFAAQAAARMRAALFSGVDCSEGGGEMSIVYPYGLIRTKPTNPEILQQYDGTQWLDVWTSVSGGSSVTYNSYGEYALNLYNESVTNYNQTVVSIAPNMPYGNSDDAARDIAICWVCSQIVATLCQQEIDRRASESNLITVMGTSALALIAAAAAIVTGGLTLAIIGVTAASGAIAIRGTAINLSALSAEFLTNEGARLKVACAMSNRIKGTNLSEATLAAAINTADYSADSVAVAIGTAIQNSLSVEDAYISFMAACESAFGYAKLNLISCPCGDEWTYEWNFLLSDCGFTRYQNYSQSPSGEWINSIGLRGGGGGASNNLLSMKLSGLSVIATRIEADVFQASSRTSIADLYGVGQFTGVTSPPFTGGGVIGNSANINGARTLGTNISMATAVDSVYVYASSVASINLQVRKLRLKGVGALPILTGGNYL